MALDPTNENAHYLLGVLFAEHGETRSTAIQHLLYAAPGVPEAHYELAQLYRLAGDEPAARMLQFRKQSAAPAEPRP